MKWSFAFAAALASSLVALTPACSTTTNVTPNNSAPTCDPTQCLAGNFCLTVGTETKCRKPCTGNTDGSCPFGYTCSGAATQYCTKLENEPASTCGDAFKGNVFLCENTPPLGCTQGAGGKWCCPESVCMKNTATIQKSDKGQWGARCNATGGLDNPDCDGAQGFKCFGVSPTDGDAYCTRYECTADLDCGPGFYCGDANVAPNVTTTQRKVGETQKVCLRRDYCAPCTSDLDCPAQNGVKAHCVPDDDLKGFCAPECQGPKNCGYDAKCVDGGIGIKTCYPRAGRCVGDGSICQPCRSDLDCGEDGACVKGQYTTERSCAKKSKIPCKDGSKQGTDFDCPVPTQPKAAIRCLGSVFEQVPVNYCHGLYPFGESADVGCWTPER